MISSPSCVNVGRIHVRGLKFSDKYSPSASFKMDLFHHSNHPSDYNLQINNRNYYWKSSKLNRPTFDLEIASSFKSLIAIDLKFVIFKFGILFAFPVDSELIREIMKSIKHPSNFIEMNDKGKMIFMMIEMILFFNFPLFCASIYSFLKYQVKIFIQTQKQNLVNLIDQIPTMKKKNQQPLYDLTLPSWADIYMHDQFFPVFRGK